MRRSRGHPDAPPSPGGRPGSRWWKGNRPHFKEALPILRRDHLHRIAAESGDDPLIRLAVELADRAAPRLVCRPGNTYACPAGMALNHAFAAKRLEVLGDQERENAEPQG